MQAQKIILMIPINPQKYLDLHKMRNKRNKVLMKTKGQISKIVIVWEIINLILLKGQSAELLSLIENLISK